MDLSRKTRMMTWSVAGWLAVAVWSLAIGVPVLAQQHRAVRLGHPATRFAPTLTEPEQLRKLLTEEPMQADVASILRQAGWKGYVEDLRQAAATAEITEVKLPKGTRLPFMSSRRNGEPIVLMDVLWDGEDPIEAYVFEFASNGRRYRCVTPKPCSNFLVEDLGPDLPRLQLYKAAPGEASLCDLIPMSVTVSNAGTVPLTQVHVTDDLPPGLKTKGNRTTLNLDAGDLKPGASVKFTFDAVASATGEFVNRAQATSAETSQVEVSATTRVQGPRLAIECLAPAEATLGRPIEVCLTLTNTGNAPESRTTLVLPIPAGVTFASATAGGTAAEGRVAWEIADLAPQSGQRVCAVFNPRKTGSQAFAATVQGACAQRADSRCETRVSGIPAILIEVVDLEDPIEVDKEVTYEIKVTNQGSAPGTQIRLVCTLPETQAFVSGSGATPISAQDRLVTMEALPTLDPKGEVSWRVIVKALKADDARFKVQLTSDQFQEPINETEATQQY